ncbi:LPS export ABC transporter periplasmic protein LptC [bacterium]|nr:LPS export ABC transporter periplasmic protein LptC [bacterium]
MKQILLYTFCLFALVACEENDLNQVASLSNEKDLPVVVMENAEIEFTDSAMLKAIISAGLVETYMFYNDNNEVTDQKLVMSNGVDARFFNKEGVENSAMTSNSAIRFEKDKKTEIEGNVKVVNIKGDSLSTEYLLWDENNNTISSDRKVRVKTDDEIIFAEGFTSDANFQEYTFKKVTGTISLK